MTLVIAVSIEDKIVVMADSRITRMSNQEVKEHYDNRQKIFPVNGRFVFALTGAAKIKLENGSYLDSHDVMEHFISINRNNFEKVSGKVLLVKLIETWNKTLTHYKLLPSDYQLNFILCEWIKLVNNFYPKIYSYNSSGKFTEGDGAFGDEEALNLINPFGRVDLKGFTAEEVILHFKNGYATVKKHVKTVGGIVQVYELNKNPLLSKWIVSPPKEE